jgi:hypothetical protein
MALTVVNPATGTFDATTRDQSSLFKKVAYAILGAGSTTQSITAQNELLGRPDFKARAKTTDNTAASQVIDLTDEGVTFPAATLRRIKFRSKATTDNDTWVQEWEQYVWGNDGTTPKLVGSPRLLNAVGIIAGTPVQYGDVRISATVATTAITEVTEHTSAGSSIAASSSGVAVLTHPIARATIGAKLVSAHFSADVTTIGEQRHVQVETGVSSTTADGQLEVKLFILPPPSVALVMTSNNLEVHVGHDATDDVYHDVEVFVGPTESNALTAD